MAVDVQRGGGVRAVADAAAPVEGQYALGAARRPGIAWCRRHEVAAPGRPARRFPPPGGCPDWIWLWEGDYETLLGLVVDLVRQAVTRYRGKIPLWHLIHRPASTDFLGLSEEEQIRIAARAIQVARQTDPSAQFTIGVERPWAEWMGSSPFQLGPLHLADYLVRADLGLSGIVLEIAPGYSAPGSHIRDLFDFSKLLDLYALLNLPLHIWFAFPSSAALTLRPIRPSGSRPSNGLRPPTRRRRPPGRRSGSPWPSPSRSSVRSTGSRRATRAPTSIPTPASSEPTSPPSRSSAG